MLRIPLGKRRRPLTGQRVDAPVLVEIVLVGRVPGALGQREYSRDDAGRDLGPHSCLAYFIENPHHVAVGDAAALRISRIDPQGMRRDLLKPRIVAIGRMGPLFVMMTDKLQRIQPRRCSS